MTFYHVVPCLKSPQDPIEQAPRTPKMKKSQCKVCDVVDHVDMGDCPKYHQLVARGVEWIVQARPPPSPSLPRRRKSTSSDLDPMSEDHITGYDEPQRSREDNQDGDGVTYPQEVETLPEEMTRVIPTTPVVVTTPAPPSPTLVNF